MPVNLLANETTPYIFWKNKSQEEKISFINGAYGAISVLKKHHKQEVKKQYNQDPNWVEPYFIERFYEILDEHRSKKIGYNVDIVADAMDAFYSNFDNGAIPILEAIRIVSLSQDGKTEKADAYLLKAQKRYKP